MLSVVRCSIRTCREFFGWMPLESEHFDIIILLFLHFGSLLFLFFFLFCVCDLMRKTKDVGRWQWNSNQRNEWDRKRNSKWWIGTSRTFFALKYLHSLPLMSNYWRTERASKRWQEQLTDYDADHNLLCVCFCRELYSNAISSTIVSTRECERDKHLSKHSSVVHFVLCLLIKQSTRWQHFSINWAATIEFYSEFLCQQLELLFFRVRSVEHAVHFFFPSFLPSFLQRANWPCFLQWRNLISIDALGAVSKAVKLFSLPLFSQKLCFFCRQKWGNEADKTKKSNRIENESFEIWEIFDEEK